MTDPTTYSIGGAVTTFCVVLAVFLVGFLVELPRRRRIRDRRRAIFAAEWRREFLVGHPLVEMPPFVVPPAGPWLVVGLDVPFENGGLPAVGVRHFADPVFVLPSGSAKI